MNNTEHFNLLTYGPDDIVNVMTVDKSNMESIDAALQKNLIQGISKATELKTDTVHALTRFDEDCPIFRFTSTTNFVAGETFVVDGQQVTALTPAGSSLATGAYVIGSEVLCILRDTRLTIFVSGASTADDALKLGGELPEFYAKQEDMDSVTAIANAAGSLAQSNLTKINEMFATEIYECPDISFAGGSIGSYAISNNINIAKSGYIPIQATIIGAGHPSAYNVCIVLDPITNKLHFIYYRAIASNVSIKAGDVNVNVLYIKD